MARYKYIGEAELILTNSLDGTRVLSPGDTVQMHDSDKSLNKHPLFKRTGGTPTPPPVPTDPPVTDENAGDAPLEPTA